MVVVERGQISTDDISAIILAPSFLLVELDRAHGDPPDEVMGFLNRLEEETRQTTKKSPCALLKAAGGRLRNEDRDVLGSGMEWLFGAYKVDIGIYGVAGVEEDGTLLDLYEEEVRARQIIRENSRSSCLVLDHRKFGPAAHVRGGRIDKTTKIFCDRSPPSSIFQLIPLSGAQPIICRKGPTL